MKTFTGNLFSYTLIFCVMLSLGCGYKLRNNLSGFQGLTVSILIENKPLNFSFVNNLKQEFSMEKVLINQESVNTDLSIKILEHEITRFSAALGTGARTREARLEYFLRVSISKKNQKKGKILEIKDSSNYTFDESRILAIEEIEERLKENFFKNAINKINFFLLELLDEDIR